jgi:hypothetical protein
MKARFNKLAWIGGLTLALCVTVSASQNTKAKTNSSAAPQAKTAHPATHFTQGTIASIDSNQLVVNRKGRGKQQQSTFTLNSDTQRTGNLAVGSRVSVQYREDNQQKTATSVREVGQKSAAKPAKAGSKSSKS